MRESLKVDVDVRTKPVYAANLYVTLEVSKTNIFISKNLHNLWAAKTAR